MTRHSGMVHCWVFGGRVTERERALCLSFPLFYVAVLSVLGGEVCDVRLESFRNTV
jgi:hypothetical protein